MRVLLLALALAACSQSPTAPAVSPSHELIKLAFVLEATEPEYCSALPDLLPVLGPTGKEEQEKLAVAAHNREVTCRGYSFRDHLKDLRNELVRTEVVVQEAEKWNKQETPPSGSDAYGNELELDLRFGRNEIFFTMGSIAIDTKLLWDDYPSDIKAAQDLHLPFLPAPDVFETFKGEIVELQVRAQTLVDRLDEQRRRLKEHDAAPAKGSTER